MKTLISQYRGPLRILGLLLALAVLNFALSFHNIWPTPWITLRPEISVEIALLVLALALYVEWRDHPSPTAMVSLASVVTVYTLARYAEVTAPALYGRGVNLYWDLRQIPGVAAMLVEVMPLWAMMLTAAGIVMAVTLVFTVNRLALRSVTHAFGSTMTRRITAASMALIVAGYAAGHSPLPVNTLRWYSLPLTSTYKQQMEFIVEAMATESRSGDSVLQPDYNLGALASSDIIFGFLESYGAVVFDEPVIARETRANRDLLAATLEKTNRFVVSAMVRSPTFGGVSWLAHASFLTGIEVANNSQYNLLLTQNMNTVPDIFKRHGYRTVAVMPGMRRAWPEGEAFYRYDRIYGELALDYRGPDFGWWRIPDQYSLARVAELELEHENGPAEPVAVFLETINTHLPFRPVPPLQENRRKLLSHQPYASAEVQASLAETPQWTDLRPSYIAAMNYTYRYWNRFFQEQGERPLVTVLLGDHQPASSVSGPGARWDVPVHVIVENPAIAEYLRGAGFVSGLVPGTESIGPMHKLVDTLLSSFSAPAGTHDGNQGEEQRAERSDGEQPEQNRP